MPASSDQLPLSLYLYNLNGTTTPSIDFGPFVENINQTTIAPGGFGDFKCDLIVPASQLRTPPTAFRAFNNIVVCRGSFMIFQGRLDEPGFVLDQTGGPMLKITALGAADCLKDDPQDQAYTTSTALTIITDQLQGSTLGRLPWLPIDHDLSLVLPNNPSATFSPPFTGKTIEEVLNELTNDLGDYQWAVWDHAENRDGQGFPTWQLQWHQRAFALANPQPTYQVRLEDILTYEIRPSIEYAFSAATILYRDQASTNPQSVTVTAPGLNGNRTQGTCAVPWRRLRKDFSAALLTAAEATAIGNALLAQYDTVGFKITIDVASISDANGQAVPLGHVRADSNLLIPDVAVLLGVLPTGYTINSNLFYINETNWVEQKNAAPKLTITCNSYYDATSFQLARIQRTNEARLLNSKSHGTVQVPGQPEKGQVGTSWGGNALTTDTYEEGVNFKASMSSAPTSITLTAQASTNANTPTTTDLTTSGFEFLVQPHANGAGLWRGSYVTVGN